MIFPAHTHTHKHTHTQSLTFLDDLFQHVEVVLLGCATQARQLGTSDQLQELRQRGREKKREREREKGRKNERMKEREIEIFDAPL